MLSTVAVPPSPKLHLYDVIDPPEMEDVALKVYCNEQGPVLTGVNDNTGAGLFISV